ncbi:adenylyltransferase/cytidyltransferase family protein [Candidatus Uhrbacteria bacterium]|nr:adenylyltransferase/cytidyltransferase family protein [Candidatus Uhrbacteria bacterium]
MSTCIFPGRFQPFHEGHLMVVQGMVKSCGNACIVICDEGKAGADAPFTVEQRREMISAALLAKDIMDATIVVVKDGGEDAQWAHRVLDECGNPEGATVWSGREEVRALFEGMGVATKKVVPVPGISSETIREQMVANNPEFRKHIPSGAIDVVMDAIKK